MIKKIKKLVSKPKPAKKAPAKTKPTKAKPTKSAKRISWVDARSQTPAIEAYARQLDSFIETMADGRVDASEIKAQEKRLVELMKSVESKLNDEQHEKVSQLLCELTAYDIMQMLFTFQESRPKTVFKG
jgi:hypothetical protein